MLDLSPATQTVRCRMVKHRLVVATILCVCFLVYMCVSMVERNTIQKLSTPTSHLRHGIRTSLGSYKSTPNTNFNTTKTTTTNTLRQVTVLNTITQNGKSTMKTTDVYQKQTFLDLARKSLTWNATDIIHVKPLPFLANYKNPCWLDTEPTMLNDLTPAGGTTSLKCLPYFLIVGQPKSGTTDLYWSLQMHPDIEKCNIKEPHWWTRGRMRRTKRSLGAYVKYFSDAARQIQNNTRITSSGEHFHQRVTGEASASTFWDMLYWAKMPENQDLDAPLYLTAHYIRHVLPNVKILVILRNPVNRLLSDSFYFSRATSPESFHEQVVSAVDTLRSCFVEHGVQRCLKNSKVINKLKARIHVGLYHEYLVGWLDVFPRSQIRILQLEEYSRNRTSALADIFKFLDLDPLPKSKALALENKAVMNARPAYKRIESMFDETRMLLDEFYRPFNERLASFLGDNKYLWDTPKPGVTYSTDNADETT